MAATASLSVLLQAVTTSFDRGMKRSARQVSGFGKLIGGVNSRLVSLAGGLAAAVSVGSITVLTKRGLDAIDVISKLSDELGIATETLASYQLAAQLTGTSNEVLQKGLQRLVRRIGEANQGYGEAIKGFKALGLEASELADLETEEALGRIADQIREMPSAAERAAASYALFGRQGQELMNFLLLGSEGLESVRMEAEALGITFDRVSGAQVEAANDAMARLKSLVTGLANTLAVQLSPFIKAAADRLREFVLESGGMSQIVLPAIESVLTGIGFLLDAINAIRIAWNAAQAAVTKFLAEAVRAAGAIVELGNSLGVLSDDTKAFFDELERGLDEEALDQWNQAKELATGDWPSERASRFFDRIRRESLAAAQAVADAADTAANTPAKILEETATEAEDLADAVDRIADDSQEIARAQSGGAGGASFRFRESFSALSVQKQQLSELEDQTNALETLIREQRKQLEPVLITF